MQEILYNTYSPSLKFQVQSLLFLKLVTDLKRLLSELKQVDSIMNLNRFSLNKVKIQLNCVLLSNRMTSYFNKFLTLLLFAFFLEANRIISRRYWSHMGNISIIYGIFQLEVFHICVYLLLLPDDLYLHSCLRLMVVIGNVKT